MNKVIPILPCPDIKEQVAFYQQLGFEVINLYTSPNPYATVRLGTIELHFYGSKKTLPAQNASMCYISVDNVDSIYDSFVNSLKNNLGKVPRAGVPKITKVRDLTDDRRFTLTDTGGNTFYIGGAIRASTPNFYRTLQSEDYARKFAILYDVVYSKEDGLMAEKILAKNDISKAALTDLDRAKLLLLELEVSRMLDQPANPSALAVLLERYKNGDDDWKKIGEKYLTILER